MMDPGRALPTECIVTPCLVLEDRETADNCGVFG